MRFHSISFERDGHSFDLGSLAPGGEPALKKERAPYPPSPIDQYLRQEKRLHHPGKGHCLSGVPVALWEKTTHTFDLTDSRLDFYIFFEARSKHGGVSSTYIVYV